MKTRNRSFRSGLLVLAAVPLLATGLAAAAQDNPGFVDLSWITIPADAIEVQDINLSMLLEQLAVEAEELGEEPLAAVLSMVQTLHLRGFALAREDRSTQEAVERLNTMLAKDGWTRLVFTKDPDGTITSINVRNHEGRLVGLTVVSYKPRGSVSFLNATGRLDLAALLELARAFQPHALGGKKAPVD